MIQTSLPNDLEGKWIWLKGDDRGTSSRYFRRDFQLSEMTGQAEIYIAARTAYHLYINGRLCHIGFTPHPGGRNYVSLLDVNYLMQVGNNRIGIQVFNPNQAMDTCAGASGGVFMELRADGKRLCCTDENWRCRQDDSYFQNGLFQRVGGPYVENLDFSAFSPNWKTETLNFSRKAAGNGRPQDENGWQFPDEIHLPEEPTFGLDLYVDEDNAQETVTSTEIVARGNCRKNRQGLWVDFQEQSQRWGNGIYAARTWLYSENDSEQVADCFCDRPYRLFLNGAEISSQAVPEIASGVLPEKRGERRLTASEYAETGVKMNLVQGWNQLVFAEDSGQVTTGMTICWRAMADESLVAYTETDESSPQGWTIRGPLNLPLRMFHPSMSFDNPDTSLYLLDENAPLDVCAMMQTCDFRQTRGQITKDNVRSTLAPHRFQVYDFGQVIYGNPILTLEGQAGDVIDVVCGEQCIDGSVKVCQNGQRNAATLTLSGHRDVWISAFPQGFRYLMVLARSAASDLNIENVQARISSCPARLTSAFACSDETLNEIWKLGNTTLGTTVQGIFLSSPMNAPYQYLGGAMIQSWAAYFSRGDYRLGSTALSSFAYSQLESGELRANVPSGIFRVIPDSSLQWVIWLTRHIMYSGDSVLLGRLFPNVRRLLDYYDALAIQPDGPIGDISAFGSEKCFLDYDQNIDRNGIVTGLNALYCKALTSASWLAAQLDEQELSEIWQKRADAVAEQIRSLTWNEAEKIFVDSYHDGAPSEICSYQTNILALYGGLVKPEDYGAVWGRLTQAEPPYEPYMVPEFNNPFFKYYVLEVAYALGQGDWALDMMRYYWGNMVAAGAKTCPEMFEPEWAAQFADRPVEQCQGAGTSPNGFLMTELVGVTPLEPGMSRIIFKPLLNAGVTWVKAQIPTTYGRISVEWKKREDGVLEVNISSTYPLEIMPQILSSEAETSEFNLSPEVSLVAEEE